MSDSGARVRKHALRAKSRAPRGEDRSRAEREALERLLELPELAGCQTVSLYAAIEDEVPAEAMQSELRGRGVRTVFPRVVGARLALFHVECLESLALGYGGIREPVGGLREVPLESVDLFCVPGILFDRRGRRLGRGRGHFDRLLAHARTDAVRVGCSYADRVVEELPEESWDILMHVVVTEREVIRNELLGR